MVAEASGMTTETTRSVLELLRTGRTDRDYETFEEDRYGKLLPRITCKDGFSLSVQAGRGWYCSPRHDAGPWTEVEIGFPTTTPEPWEEWAKYVEDSDRPTDTVYARVPLTLVEALVASHGGEA